MRFARTSHRVIEHLISPTSSGSGARRLTVPRRHEVRNLLVPCEPQISDVGRLPCSSGPACVTNQRESADHWRRPFLDSLRLTTLLSTIKVILDGNDVILAEVRPSLDLDEDEGHARTVLATVRLINLDIEAVIRS